ncbi:hypothetical protein HG536_0E03510 [Torulaspora globosa]|uniref:AMP-dependent synthetase/ligase domain-containing protein n=1 Tax=Torulaspora globosa TaxID=48254 RepID=A0A7G3ZIV4_9SACH|nr:uncharacterized protein HG536_0E03510 [Torulaspora globosa]QLL33440.1 hypothetical protein HG536_0E03510 [Torulaspora globosa]
MDWLLWIKVLVTVALVVFGANWLFGVLYLNANRDFTSVALSQQSNVGSVRKENETAHYRNFLVPLGFPLITGLSLSLKYKIRNGNFGDVWKAVMEVSNRNFVQFTNDERRYSLDAINGMALHILKTQFPEDTKKIGIVVPPSSLQGFVIALASMMGSIKTSCQPNFLSSVPRTRDDDLDVLVIESWSAYRMLNGSDRWYKLVVVLESGPLHDMPSNAKTWEQLVEDYKEITVFDYVPPEDNSDDTKLWAYTTSAWNATTSFTQGCLVSGIASFVQNFPTGHELSNKDHLTVVSRLGDSSSAIHLWHKAFAVLLHGGSLSFLSEALALSDLRDTSLLFIESKDLMRILQQIKVSSSSIIKRVGFAWATTLLSEGVFSKLGQYSSPSVNNLRCVFLAEFVRDAQLVSSFPRAMPKFKPGASKQLFTSEMLNFARAHLGARVVVELYCPSIIMSPLCQTNFYDYRVLPASVTSKFFCYGPLATNLEGKMVRIEQNSEFDITKRQGLLCVRGFAIGKPVEADRLKNAMHLSEEIGGGEGWMPLAGLYGIWGHDGCLYIYK